MGIVGCKHDSQFLINKNNGLHFMKSIIISVLDRKIQDIVG